MPTGRTGPEREHAFTATIRNQDDCKLSCYYHNHPFNQQVCTKHWQKVAGTTESNSGGPENAQKYAF